MGGGDIFVGLAKDRKGLVCDDRFILDSDLCIAKPDPPTTRTVLSPHFPTARYCDTPTALHSLIL